MAAGVADGVVDECDPRQQGRHRGSDLPPAVAVVRQQDVATLADSNHRASGFGHVDHDGFDGQILDRRRVGLDRVILRGSLGSCAKCQAKACKQVWDGRAAEELCIPHERSPLYAPHCGGQKSPGTQWHRGWFLVV